MKINDMVGNCKIIARIKNLFKENKLYLSLLGCISGGLYMVDQMHWIRSDLLSQSQNNILLIGTGLGFFFAIYLGHMLEIYRGTVNEISSIFAEAQQYKSFKRRAIFAIMTWFAMIFIAVFIKLESPLWSPLIPIVLFITFFFCILFLHEAGERLSDIDQIVEDLFEAIVKSGKDLKKIENLYKKIKPKAMKDKALAISVIHYTNKYLINNDVFIKALKAEILEECEEVENNIKEGKPFSYVGKELYNGVINPLFSIIKEHYAECGVESIFKIFNIWVTLCIETEPEKPVMYNGRELRHHVLSEIVNFLMEFSVKNLDKSIIITKHLLSLKSEYLPHIIITFVNNIVKNLNMLEEGILIFLDQIIQYDIIIKEVPNKGFFFIEIFSTVFEKIVFQPDINEIKKLRIIHGIVTNSSKIIDNFKTKITQEICNQFLAIFDLILNALPSLDTTVGGKNFVSKIRHNIAEIKQKMLKVDADA